MDNVNELPDFNQLRRLAREKHPQGLRIALAGDCATQHLATAIQGYATFQCVPTQVFDADYNQIRAQVMDPGSELCEFSPEYFVIYMCAEKLWEAYCTCDDRTHFAQNTAIEIESYWQMFSANCPGARILQFNFVEDDDRIFGNYSQVVCESFLYQTRLLNLKLSDLAAIHKNAYIVDLCSLQSRVGRQTLFNDKLYYIAKMPIDTGCLPLVAKEVMDVILALQGKIKKCVIVDLDNTLWGGVIGDDGLSGIQIGELGIGHAFSEFQAWLKELKKRGILLAVCSKNNEDTAKEPFEKHPEMVLRLDDFSIFVANWQDKASNIQYIQQTLNLGMDSFVFLDDNPFERNLVRSLIPQITVPELPEDPSQYLSYLKSLNLFETASYSDADANRTRQYQEEVGRTQLQQSFASFDEYLQGLCMEAEAKPFDEFHYPRIAQLTQRSNQFNLRTIRYTQADIAAVAQDPNKMTLYFTLRDKFGDYGLISVVIMEKVDDTTLFVDTWLMSCRVLKRGMEEFIINTMVKTARENGFTQLHGEYLPTPKNAMVRDIYERLGFTPTGNGTYCCSIAKFQENKTFINHKEN